MLRYFVLFALFAAAPAQALIITPLSVHAEATAETPGGSNSDSQTTTGTASVNQTSTYTKSAGGHSTTDTVTAKAYQRTDGLSRIELKVKNSDSSDAYFAATGENSGYGARGLTKLTLEYKNDGSQDVSPIFNFSLSDIYAETFNGGSGPVEVNFDYKAYVLGGGDSYNASGTARHEYNNAQFINANNMSASIAHADCMFGVCNKALYSFGDISDSIMVGLLHPNDIANIVVEMSVQLNFNGLEQGAYARIQDPNGGSAFNYWTTFANAPGGSATVPEPTTWLLILNGLLAIRWRVLRSD